MDSFQSMITYIRNTPPETFTHLVENAVQDPAEFVGFGFHQSHSSLNTGGRRLKQLVESGNPDDQPLFRASDKNTNGLALPEDAYERGPRVLQMQKQLDDSKDLRDLAISKGRL